MAVDRRRHGLQQRLNDWQTQSQVWDEVVVHHVHMKPVSRTGDAFAFGGQLAKIGRQDAG